MIAVGITFDISSKTKKFIIISHHKKRIKNKLCRNNINQKMSNKVKDIDIKNRTYYFFNDIINIKNFDPNNFKIDGKSYKDILIYYIGYVTIKDLKYVKINSVNPLYFIFNKVDGYLEEINGNEYLTLVPTNVSKKQKKKI